ncbi:MAG TPA: DUF4373 domain-containing protein [Candidatus Faecivivens stercoravium]|uniref:DUF4373 domain-containing protein n=1 Tax=Candidatus Faecivivens stercoravium TaxID=2840803 RepID=A0A9D1DX79_9FIRM|nr:DUF4373 domain-containing protein [Candidatus Faecivivens stercoravium]
MARAVGNGLRYFPKDVDYYMDDRIMDLLDAYGPLGQTIYDVMLTMVYREGYYLEMAPDRLARQIIRWIGSQWVESREKVVEVLGFIAEVGLIDEPLYRQGVITSAAIQRRYDEVAARRKTDRSKYWLLEAEPAAETETIAAKSAGCAAECVPNAAECAPNAPSAVPSAAETPLFAAESAQSKEKETRGNKTKAKETKQKESSAKEREREGKGAGLPAPRLPPSPAKRYGHYQNVLLPDDEYASLQSELGRSLPVYIDKLSAYMEAKGRDYPSHGATIRKWFTDDRLAGKVPRPPHQPSYDIEAFEAGGFELLDLPDWPADGKTAAG